MPSIATCLSNKRILTIPTLITSIRIFLTPFIVMRIVDQSWGMAFLFVVIAAFTDVIDGAVARYLHEQTLFGACFDPVADKIFVLSTCAALSFVQLPYQNIPLWFFFFLFCKELIQVGSVLCLYLLGKSFILRPTWVGKLTTLLQIICVLVLISSYFFAYTVKQSMFYVLLLSIILMSIVSYVQYVALWYKQRKNITQ